MADRADVWRLARQLCQHREDAEDVTQSALLKPAQHLDGFRWEASLRTWLHRIATGECRMLRRRKVPLSPGSVAGGGCHGIGAARRATGSRARPRGSRGRG